MALANVFTDLGYADAGAHRTKAELVRKTAAVMNEQSLSQSAATRPKK